MPRDLSIKKVLVIGSGPIVIGQAAEFDYAGTQACRSLKEEGIEVVLLNSNPATIMTDKDIADRVYIEPLTVEVVEQLIKKERPDSVLPTLGGQAGLNLAMELEEAGFLKENGVRLIGTTSETIRKAEDRLEFKATMEKIGEPVAASLVVENVDDGLAFANKIGYPVVLRPAYTLGGSGGGIAHDSHQLVEILVHLRHMRTNIIDVEDQRLITAGLYLPHELATKERIHLLHVIFDLQNGRFVSRIRRQVTNELRIHRIHSLLQLAQNGANTSTVVIGRLI